MKEAEKAEKETFGQRFEMGVSILSILSDALGA